MIAAASGVAVLIGRAGELPWIGLVLALAFGFYGLLRKTIDVAPLPGSAIEASGLFAVDVVLEQQRKRAL